MPCSMYRAQQHSQTMAATAAPTPNMDVLDAVRIPPVEPGLGVMVQHFIVDQVHLSTDLHARWGQAANSFCS